jgi:tight adherence protein C
MTEVLVYGGLLGAGALLLLTAQPVGAPRPSLRRRLNALQRETSLEPSRLRERVSRSRLFEDALRPTLESVGERTARFLGRLGVDLRATEERLRAVSDRGGLPLFLGQKLAGGLIGLAFLPVAASFGIAPPTPVWVWIAAAAGGFSLPDTMLKSRAECRRRRMRENLVHFAELLALAVSAGLGVEGALEQAASAGQGPLFDEVRRLLREARMQGEPSSEALARLPAEAGLPEADPLAQTVRAGASQGAPVTQALRALGRTLRERRRLDLVEAGERAQVRMLLPIGLLILPAFFVLLLYPAAVQLLRLTGP